jgi:hypothetical protein
MTIEKGNKQKRGNSAFQPLFFPSFLLELLAKSGDAETIR